MHLLSRSVQTVLVPALAQFDFTTGNADEENEVYQFIVRKISGFSPLPLGRNNASC
jgi:hypothetical protein